MLFGSCNFPCKKIYWVVVGCLLLISFWFLRNTIEIDEVATFRKANYSNLNRNYHVSKLISTLNCHDKPLHLLILVTSNVSSFERRETVRRTWGKDIHSYKNDDFRTFFVVGKSHDETEMAKLKKESDYFKDIIIGDYYEMFYNLPYKFETIFEWAYKHCLFKFLLKTDDDVFMNLSHLFKLLSDKNTPKQKLYTGRAQFYANVLRKGKYAVEYSDYAKRNYPPFVGGGAVIFSHDVVQAVIPYFSRPVFKLDDLYVAMLVANTGVKALHQKKFYTVESYCYYDGSAVALHFHDKSWKNASICTTELFYKMLADNVEDEFTRFHYIDRKQIL